MSDDYTYIEKIDRYKMTYKTNHPTIKEITRGDKFMIYDL